MASQTLAEWVAAQDDLVRTLREQGRFYEDNFPVVPNEYTNWLDELRATVESAGLADLSHHMTAVRLEGSDAIRLLKHLCVNDFDDFAVGQAKQIIMCNHRGHIMGDGPLLRLGEETFYGPGIHATKWLRYNYEVGDYDVDLAIEPPTPLLDGDPAAFVYQVQGPRAHDVLDELTDADLDAIGFYRFRDVELAGHAVRAFGHGMSPEAGFELHGPYEHADELRAAIVEAGEPYGLRELGSKVYLTGSVRLGWVPPFMKPVYDGPEMAGYRRWVDAEKERRYGKYSGGDSTLEAAFSIEGSYDGTAISDYYMSPVELGYGRLVDLDHEFVGRAAIAEELAEPRRTLVSLLWDEADVNRVNTSIMGDGPTHKFMDNLPRVGWASMAYDAVTRDGELVGISHSRAYEWDIRGIVSLCRLDVEHAEPGTDVSVVWGEPDGESPNPKIEAHAQTEIAATVAEAPYVEDRR